MTHLAFFDNQISTILMWVHCGIQAAYKFVSSNRKAHPRSISMTFHDFGIFVFIFHDFPKKVIFYEFFMSFSMTVETLHLGVICMSKDTTGWAEYNGFKYKITTQRMLGLLVFFQIGFLFTLYNSFYKEVLYTSCSSTSFHKKSYLHTYIQNFINLHNVKHRYSQWFPISNIWWITKSSTTLPEYT